MPQDRHVAQRYSNANSAGWVYPSDPERRLVEPGAANNSSRSGRSSRLSNRGARSRRRGRRAVSYRPRPMPVRALPGEQERHVGCASVTTSPVATPAALVRPPNLPSGATKSVTGRDCHRHAMREMPPAGVGAETDVGERRLQVGVNAPCESRHRRPPGRISRSGRQRQQVPRTFLPIALAGRGHAGGEGAPPRRCARWIRRRRTS